MFVEINSTNPTKTPTAEATTPAASSSPPILLKKNDSTELQIDYNC